MLDNQTENNTAPIRKPHRFQKGVSGNPKGRPKGSGGLTDALRRDLQSKVKGIPYAERVALELGFEPEKMTLAELLVAATINAASRGCAPLVKELWDRAEGKVPEKLQHTGADGGAIVTKQEFDWDAYRAAKAIEADRAGGRISATQDRN